MLALDFLRSDWRQEGSVLVSLQNPGCAVVASGGADFPGALTLPETEIAGYTWLNAQGSLIVFVTPLAYRPAVVALTLLSALLLVVLKRPAFYGRPVSALVFWIPVTFVLYFVLAGVLSGVIFHAPILLLVSLLIFAFLLFLHLRRWGAKSSRA